MFPISDSIPSRRFPFLNIVIILITIYAFYLQISFPNQEVFIQEYALIPSLVNFNDPQTFLPFITSIFLHGGFLHIVSNMWFLWVFGDNVETHIPWFFYPLLYILSGIAGGLAQYIFAPQSSIPMLGASGAVAGVLGAYYVLFPNSRIKTIIPVFGFASIVHVGAPFMLGYWFILQLFSGVTSLPMIGETGGVAFFAHVGGFITGVILAKFFKGQHE